ncbi:DUF397 domain-containing protein [Streptomyces sp. NBC_01485]|uniref:DUF397 domain-containing protein n=1 Tax=Streptomyces sp. NBC_01485 TaxID=2903884 RepID=UPI002E2F3C16|nr:DUF397 domain-containing protein [Streptomyces sp. NBC_01485]
MSEVPVRELQWQKSSFSGDDANRDCVELAVASGGEALLLRESDEPAAVLHATPASLHALLDTCKAPTT